MLILREKEFGNPANKAFRKAFELSNAKGLLGSAGFKSCINNPKDIANAKHVLRTRARAGQSGAAINNSKSGIVDSLMSKGRDTTTNLNQRINVKSLIERDYRGFDRQKAMKEVMQGKRWERITPGPLGSHGVPYIR